VLTDRRHKNSGAFRCITVAQSGFAPLGPPGDGAGAALLAAGLVSGAGWASLVGAASGPRPTLPGGGAGSSAVRLPYVPRRPTPTAGQTRRGHGIPVPSGREACSRSSVPQAHGSPTSRGASGVSQPPRSPGPGGMVPGVRTVVAPPCWSALGRGGAGASAGPSWG
jgi:hypothetical protein